VCWRLVPQEREAKENSRQQWTSCPPRNNFGVLPTTSGGLLNLIYNQRNLPVSRELVLMLASKQSAHTYGAVGRFLRNQRY
jgi:hypothetical protein